MPPIIENRPRAIFRLVFVESMVLAGVGLAIGLLLAVPAVLYFQANPIPITGENMAGAWELFGIEPVITWKLKPMNPIGSAVTIFAVAALAAVYPAFRASRTRPLDAIRGV